jgi:hypothetical protein
LIGTKIGLTINIVFSSNGTPSFSFNRASRSNSEAVTTLVEILGYPDSLNSLSSAFTGFGISSFFLRFLPKMLVWLIP